MQKQQVLLTAAMSFKQMFSPKKPPTCEDLFYNLFSSFNLLYHVISFNVSMLIHEFKLLKFCLQSGDLTFLSTLSILMTTDKSIPILKYYILHTV